MKRFIIFFLILFIPVFSYSQEKESSHEDVTITINLSKISRGVDKVVSSVKEEINQYKQEYEENVSEERKEKIKNAPKKAKEHLKYYWKDFHDEIHHQFVRGLRGEPYDGKKK